MMKEVDGTTTLTTELMDIELDIWPVEEVGSASSSESLIDPELVLAEIDLRRDRELELQYPRLESAALLVLVGVTMAMSLLAWD